MEDIIQLPLDRPHPTDPPARLRALQAERAVHRVRTLTGDPAWLVTGFELAQALFSDPRLGQSHPDPANAARSADSVLHGGPRWNFATEREDHATFRQALQPHFSPKRMRELQPRIETICRDLLDDLDRAEQPADLIESLAVPLPILVICELLGVPYADRRQFRAWSEAAGDTVHRARSQDGLAGLFGYGQQLVRRKRAEPADDVISRLCAETEMTDDHIAMLSMSLLFAGHETTVAALGFGALLLLTHPEQWQRLREHPALIPEAVEEMIRGPGRTGTAVVRYAREDIQVEDFTILAGQLVLLDHNAGSNDPAVFPEPDRFDPARKPAHLAFGHGAHYCIGAPLARMELRTAFTQLIQRFPAMRLAVPAAALTLAEDRLMAGLTALPVYLP